jgi:hypothetical protein
MMSKKKLLVRPPGRHFTEVTSNRIKSKKRILSGRTAVSDVALVTSDEIVKRGASSILADLGKQIDDNDARSHQFLHIKVASIYRVAQEAKANRSVWSDICRSPKLKDAPRQPNPERPKDVLRFALMASRGSDKSGRKFSSDWAGRLNEHYKAGLPAETVLKIISQRKSSRNASASEAARPKSNRYDLGVVNTNSAQYCIVAAGTKTSLVLHAPEAKAVQAFVLLFPKPADAEAKGITPQNLAKFSQNLIKVLAKRASKLRLRRRTPGEEV